MRELKYDHAGKLVWFADQAMGIILFHKEISEGGVKLFYYNITWMERRVWTFFCATLGAPKYQGKDGTLQSFLE